MNTQTYRLVFNPARACMVAVAETAHGCGKGGRARGTRVGRRKGVLARSCKQNTPVAPELPNYYAINSGVFSYANGITLSIESTGGNITGQSAQLSGKKILAFTTKAQDGKALDANGKPIAATAGGGSINFESLQVNGKTVEQSDNAEWSAMTTRTQTTVKGTMTATGDGTDGGITISANKDVALSAIALDAGKGNVHVQAGGNVKLGANADVKQTQQSHDGGGRSFWTTTKTHTNYQTQDVNAAVTSLEGNDITVKAGDTLTNYAADIQGTGTVQQIAGNSALTYTATQSRSASVDSKSSTSFLGMVEVGRETSTTTAMNTQELGSKIFGKQVGVQAKDVVIKGADVVATELVQIEATDSVSITAATNTFTTQHDENKRMLGITANIGSGVSLNSSSSTLSTTQTATSSSASTISGQNVVITSGGDTTIQASNVIADKDVSVTAGGNINILAAKNTETNTSQSTSSSTSIGLLPGLSPRQTLFAHTETAGNGQGTSTTHTTSVLSANGGNLNLTANNGVVTVQGADLLAQDKVSIKAKEVDLQAITDSTSSSNHLESKSITVGSALAGTVGSKITAISDNLQLASTTSNDRLKGAATLKAGYDAYKFYDGGASKALADAGKFREGLAAAGQDPSKADPNSGSAFGVSFSVGINSSKQDNSSATTTSRGTNIQAKDIEITATSGNITATGAKLQGDNISLDAAKDINLLAAVNTNALKSSNESHSLGAGITIGLGKQSGISFQVNAGQANGNTQGTEVGYDNTLVTASNKLTVKSGGDTNLVGAQLAGNSVKMNVGGDLNIVTLQDTSKFDSEQHSSGIALSVCVPPFCAGGTVTGSVSKSDSTIAHNYISATGQSGIAAGNKDGSGGYDITVKGNTDLKGGAITSTAPKDQNTLSTGSLTSSDLANAQSTNSSSSSISLGYSGSSAISTMASNVSANVLGNLSAGAGMPANGSSSGTTQSVISAGNVTITGTGDATTDANSNAQVATLTQRDASKANGALTNTLTLQQAQLIPGQVKEAQENAQAANMVGAAMNGMIGDLGYAPGSPQATILHGFSGVVQASIGGTNAVSGFASGVFNEQAVTAMGAYLNSKGVPTTLNGKPDGPVNPEYAELMKAGSTLLGAGSAAALGGSPADIAAAANIARNGTEFNMLQHLLKIAEKGAKAGGSVGQASISMLQRCMANQACNSLLPAGAAAWLVGQTLNDALPRADDLVPSVPTSFEITHNKQPTHTGNNNPAPQLGIATTTPGDTLINPGTPGLQAANPLPGNNSTVTVNNGPVAPITTGGFGEGTQPVVSPIMMSAGQNPSGANGGGKVADVGLEIPPGKFDYLFGRSVSNEHNAARSNQLALEMKRLGVPDTPSGQKMLSEHLTQSVKAEGNVVNTFSNQYGTFEVRESLFMGPSGKAANLQSTFQILPDGTRRLSTVIPRH